MGSAMLVLLGQGLLHGVGPDHCLAIGALSARGGLRETLRMAVRFGLGHTVVLAVLATLAVVAGVVIPARWESTLEMVGGASLLALGIWTLASREGTLRVPHVHADGTHHAHGEDEPEARADDAAPTAPSSRRWLAGVAGAVFGLSGVRGLVLLLPFATRQHRGALVAGVLCFGLGVVLSMVTVGWLTQRAAQAASKRAASARNALRIAVGVASVLCGAWWVVSHLDG